VFVFKIISNLVGPVEEGGLTPRAWILGERGKGFCLELQPEPPCNFNPMLGSNLLQVMKVLYHVTFMCLRFDCKLMVLYKSALID